MVNEILDAVTKQLGKTFGNSYHYYVEDVQQNLTLPAFTVDMLIPLERSKSPVLYDRTMPLVVHYFSDKQSSPKRDCYNIAERVLECLEYIPYENSMLRGENLSWEIVDDVLQIFVTYKFTTIMSKETEENMEDILDNVVRAN